MIAVTEQIVNTDDSLKGALGSPARWEYCVMVHDARDQFYNQQKLPASELEQRFNKLGAEGWEMVAVLESHASGTQFAQVLFLFKRQIAQ
jgi:hypothetical protein